MGFSSVKSSSSSAETGLENAPLEETGWDAPQLLAELFSQSKTGLQLDNRAPPLPANTQITKEEMS